MFNFLLTQFIKIISSWPVIEKNLSHVRIFSLVSYDKKNFNFADEVTEISIILEEEANLGLIVDMSRGGQLKLSYRD